MKRINICKMCYMVFGVDYRTIKSEIKYCPNCGQKELMEIDFQND